MGKYEAEDEVLLQTAQELRSTIPTFLGNVRAAYPFFFDKEELIARLARGDDYVVSILPDAKYDDEFAKLKETFTNDNELTSLINILAAYGRLAQLDLDNLPKDLQQVVDTKKRQREYKERVQAKTEEIAPLVNEVQTVYGMLLIDGRVNKDAFTHHKTLDGAIQTLTENIKKAYPYLDEVDQLLRVEKVLLRNYQDTVNLAQEIKQGGGQPGPISRPDTRNWATWKSCSKHKNKAACQTAKCTEWSTKTNGSANNAKAKKGTCSKKGPGAKLHTKAECKGKGHDSKAWKATTAEKKGMAWYWWVVIIGGILAVLGTVAYLFLGSDASNDEEWSPEEAEA